jgi:hypothetical protein
VIALLITLSACGGSSGAFSADISERAGVAPIEGPISVPLSLYVVLASDDPSLSSQRTPEGLALIGDAMNDIWAPSRIVFDPIQVETITVPTEVLAALADGNNSLFLEQAQRTFDVPSAGVINGFYVRNAGGPNGFTPFNTRVFFVGDAPTVHDERVSSHEVGHLFGLRHATDDIGRLMFLRHEWHVVDAPRAPGRPLRSRWVGRQCRAVARGARHPASSRLR